MHSSARTPGSSSLRLFSYAALVYAAIAWGTTFILVKDAVAEIGPLILVTYRFGLAGAALLLLIFLRKESPLLHLGHGIKLGLLLTVLYLAQAIGLQHTSATNAGFITGLFVAFLPLFVFLFEKKYPTLRDLSVISVALAGLWFLTGGIRGVNSGDFFILVAAGTYAAYIPLVNIALKEGARALPLIMQSFLVTSILSFIGALIHGESFGGGMFDGALWAVIIFLALVPSLSAYIAQFFAQRHVPPLAVGATFLLEPVFATLFSVSWGGETLHVAQAFGGLIILLAMAFAIDWKMTEREHKA